MGVYDTRDRNRHHLGGRKITHRKKLVDRVTRRLEAATDLIAQAAENLAEWQARCDDTDRVPDEALVLANHELDMGISFISNWRLVYGGLSGEKGGA